MGHDFYLQGNWCCPEGSIEAWVVVQHSQLVRGSLLSPSPDKAGCLQVADLADSSTVQHAVAIALEDRFVSGHARVNVFVSTAFEAAMKTEQATIRDSLHCLIQTLQQQDHQLKVCTSSHTTDNLVCVSVFIVACCLFPCKESI